MGFSAHEWQGKVFLIWVYGIAAFWMILFLVPLTTASAGTPLGVWEAVILIALAGVHLAIARAVARFRNWGWWAGMLMGILTLPLGILFLYYFWTRRVRFEAR